MKKFIKTCIDCGAVTSISVSNQCPNGFSEVESFDSISHLINKECECVRYSPILTDSDLAFLERIQDAHPEYFHRMREITKKIIDGRHD